ncbi:MAG: hypothetical protein V2I27_00240 [Erythrobacter sp.]|jgi:hypothetical protein|nr:hypothetical protein [Erythrobacter sp.]
MSAPAEVVERPKLPSIVIARSHGGYVVAWRRDGRPTRRTFTELGAAIAHAHQAALLLDLALVDLTAAGAN